MSRSLHYYSAAFFLITLILVMPQNVAIALEIPKGWRKIFVNEVKLGGDFFERKNYPKLMISTRGDFDNNGIEDEANILTSNDSSGKAAVFVNLGLPNGKLKIIKLMDMESFSFYGIKKVTMEFDKSYCNDEVLKEMNPADSNPCKDIIARDYKYNGDVIEGVMFDSSSWYWIWDKDNQEFFEFYTDD